MIALGIKTNVDKSPRIASSKRQLNVIEFLKKYMRIVDLWLLCKMWKSRVVWPGLDVDRQVGIENNVYAAPVS